jgi:hypothetical protein
MQRKATKSDRDTGGWSRRCHKELCFGARRFLVHIRDTTEYE